MARKKNKSTKQFIITLIILVAFFSVLIFFGRYNTQKKLTKDNYNNFPFYFDKNEGFWYTQIQIGKIPYNIPFYHHPRELEDIIVEDNIEDIIWKNRPENIIISVPNNSSSEIALAGIEISKLTGERFHLLRIPTTSAVNEEFENLPFATCDDADENTVVISFERSDKNLVSSSGRCIILEFKEEHPINVADAFAYHLLKIM
ncbi:MAG: hypothetical protein H8D38_01875 [DPANN group archaeon]|nr:hypothetical protein [DPANN group archaeon]